MNEQEIIEALTCTRCGSALHVTLVRVNDQGQWEGTPWTESIGHEPWECDRMRRLVSEDLARLDGGR